MRKRFIPILLSLIMLFVPLVLSGCIGSGGGDSGGGDSGGDSGGGDSGGGDQDLSSFSDYFNGVKVVEKMSFDDMSVGSPAYNFTSNVVEQIKTLSTEILLRLCGDFGDGLSVANALLYDLVIEEDIMPEDYELEYGVGCFEVIHFDKWEWKHVKSTDRLPYPSTQIQYIQCYLEEYAPEQKENYEDKLTLELFKLLSGVTPQDLEQETLLNCAKSFDHTGFLDSDVNKIENFILNNIIGEEIIEADEYLIGLGVTQTVRYYTAKVEAIVDTCVNRTVSGVPAYPVMAAAQFNEKTVEDFGVNLLSESPLSAPAKQYRSIVFNTKKVIDITSFTMLLEVPQSESTEQVTINITGKYQVYNANTSSYDIIRAKLGTTVVNPGIYNMNTNSNEFNVDFKKPSLEDFEESIRDSIDLSLIPDYTVGNEYYEIHHLNALRLALFTNNSPLDAGATYTLGTTGGLLNYDNYFKVYEKTTGFNIEYEDNTTPFFQMFFEIVGNKQDINFKFAFMDIAITEVK